MTMRGFVTALAILLAAAAVFTAGRNAWSQSGVHGDGHAQGHDVYRQWSPPNNPGTSCCNAEKPDGTGDCRPTRAFVGDDGLWHAWNGIKWLVVPPSRVLPPNFAGDGRSHLCEKLQFIFCFSPGEIRG